MRKIDYFAGVPLCFFGNLIYRICQFLFAHPPSTSIRNLLFIELSEMGSTILADPAMRKIQRTSGASLHFVIFAKNRSSLDLLSTVPRENVFVLRENGFFVLLADTLKFLVWTRKRKIDTVIDLELFSRFTALLTGFSGAVRKVGFHAFHNEGLYRGDFLTHKVSYNPHQHIAKNFISLVNALLSTSQEYPYSKTIISDDEIVLEKVAVGACETSAMLERIHEVCPGYDETRQHIVLLNANASELLPQRCWPPENYVALAKEILKRYENIVILCTGSRAEFEGIEAIVTAISNGRCINFAGRTTMAELPALYSLSALMLSNDSGPAHFAAVTRMRTYILFGPETPQLYGSLGDSIPIFANMACSPCVSATNHRKTPCSDNVCLQVITPAHVLDILTPGLLDLC
jgi:ADP-heptose:LPS heptosyltransferase